MNRLLDDCPAGSSREVLMLIIGTLANGLIGMIDDLMIVRRKNSGGLKPLIKIVLQTLFASCLCWAFYRGGNGLFHASLVLTPLFSIAMGALMLPFSVFTIVAEANSVNLTDGLDGLAAGTCTISLSGMALILSSHNLPLATMCAAMCGGCIGVVANAFVPLTMVTSVFALEAMSVILQVGCYSLTRKVLGRGVRLFKMSPFHHHLEVCGWHETKITPLFYLAAAATTLMAIQFGMG
ncbi:hypothetical protein BSKO_05003 [Bryopsis sp. KO-2023]|nr:hypothetical protein BSKO_05003 [Bryopsis sp. KO-2023]